MRKLLSLVTLLGALGATSLFDIGCAGQSISGPTSVSAATLAPTPASSGTLTIRVLSRSSGEPISGAAIAAATMQGATDASGLWALPVTPGQEMDVQVSARGYESMGASAVVGSNERWTFYLPPADATPPAAQ
jgi:hypothetical protein